MFATGFYFGLTDKYLPTTIPDTKIPRYDMHTRET